MIAVGRRSEAQAWIRDTYRVTDEEAGKLLEALDSESPMRRWGWIDRRKLLRWAGFGVFLLGLLLIGVGVSRIFAYTEHDEHQLATVNGVVSAVTDFPDGTTEITISYTYQEQSYSNTERSTIFRDLGFQRGAPVEVWVNVQHPEEALLPILKPFVQAEGRRIALIGVILVMVSIFFWRMFRHRISIS